MNTKDHQIQENKRGPDVCPGFGNGARKRKKRNESKAKKKERNKKEDFFRKKRNETKAKKKERNKKRRIFQEYGVDSTVHNFYGTYIGLKKKALFLHEHGKSYKKQFLIPNPAQINEKNMDFFLPPRGTTVNGVKK